MSKFKILVTAMVVIAVLSTDALAGRKKGAAIGALVGAGAGLLTEQKIKEMEAKSFFEDGAITLKSNSLTIKYPDETVSLNIVDNSRLIPRAIKQLNATMARQTPKWENLSGTFSFKDNDLVGHIDFVKDKRASIFAEQNGDTTYLIDLISESPGAWAYVKSFVLNNIIFVCVIVFGILGSLFPWLKKKIAGTKKV